MTALKRVIAFAFRRKDVDRLSAADFRNSLSLDLRWFSPPDARRLLALAVERRLLLAEGEDVSPAFAVESVHVPVDWRPGPEVFEEPAEAGLIEEIVDAIQHVTNEDKPLIQKAIRDEETRTKGVLAPEVAALLVASRRRVVVTPFLARAQEFLGPAPKKVADSPR